ncbi:DNA-dependent helicase II [compost metagenome]
MERDTTPPVTTFARNLVQRKTEARPVATAATSHVPSTDFVPTDTFDLAEGDKVEHLKFGFGVVTKMDVNGTDRKATVKFDLVGEKTLLLSFAKLRVLK